VDAPLASGFQVADGGGTYGGHDAYDGTVNFTVRTNQINTVTLFASGYLNGTTSGHVDIYVDPVFSFATPMEGYSLAFSNGIGNALPDESVGGVPEPASWALMIGGFGLAGVALRRRRAFIPA
jgi:hypothetical protein